MPRCSALLLAFALAACDALPASPPDAGAPSGGPAHAALLVLPPAPPPDTVEVVVVWGTSNARRLYFEAVPSYVYARPDRTTLFVNAAIGSKLVTSHPTEPDWNPASGELFTRGVQMARNALIQARAARPGSVVVGRVLWNQGNDLIRMFKGELPDLTLDEVRLANEELLLATAAELPGWKVDWTTSTVVAGEHESPLYAEGIPMERDVCLAAPNCTLAFDLSLEISADWASCSTDACREQFYEPDHIHWKPPTLRLVMEAAARAAS